jgi:hypothetical protein
VWDAPVAFAGPQVHGGKEFGVQTDAAGRGLVHSVAWLWLRRVVMRGGQRVDAAILIDRILYHGSIGLSKVLR